ncbi:DUF1285 domain-containing protein [Marinobacter salicampi]|uniref:DUF1285 domain-containing protein n=1 Tax=Marinobacter salicampi TaxID=435907 RepID=UPI001408212A|nr:DUF1285 domain-containing protein [Marinobacter salicampi]
MSPDPKGIEAQIEAAKPEPNARPPLEKWDPEFSGDIDIRIARDGDWYYQGEKMAREALVRLFSTILRREDDGEYYLVTPVEKWRIKVEDTPLMAHNVTVMGEGQQQKVEVTTNTGESITLGREHSLHMDTYPGSDEPRPLVDMYHGLQARLGTAAFYELVRYVTDNPDGTHQSVGVWSDGVFFELGKGA